MDELTAAHRTLPFGTMVRVTRLDNGKSIDVRITDRGPFIDGRIIDLSREAARRIEMLGPGVSQVRIDVLDTEAVRTPPAGQPAYAVQVGAFRVRANAESMARKLEAEFAPVSIVERDSDVTVWRVLVGRKAALDEAEQLAGALRARLGTGALVVRLDQ